MTGATTACGVDVLLPLFWSLASLLVLLLAFALDPPFAAFAASLPASPASVMASMIPVICLVSRLELPISRISMTGAITACGVDVLLPLFWSLASLLVLLLAFALDPPFAAFAASLPASPASVMASMIPLICLVSRPDL
ncbi:hypothetical protein GGU10DRAFT_358151 [Lentinula aff. detonsa]|uniref:Uncharacterized protein n=1 Tax=Lentinula aff. detonsa TaxID=2804958 RepID=A0AA38NCK5_9AGAR|nr:hypothetical protein GGU10DRAFT_358151 [Lentinula aff. detonsa]